MRPKAPILTRRTFLSAAGMVASAAFGSRRLGAEDRPPQPGSFRVVQITDTHVFENWGCEQKFSRMSEALAAVRPAPGLILHTGDVIMDGLVEPTRSDVRSQWRLWHKLARSLPNVETRYILGNHDTWMNEVGPEPHRGKRLAMEELGLTRPYYAFEVQGWKFIMLDSVRPIFEERHYPYASRLDETQKDWFLAELRDTGPTAPLMVCTHVPVLSAAIFAAAAAVADQWTVSGPAMHSDSHEIQAALRDRSGPTICLSGHLHLTDEVAYDGIHYLCGGAVCGDWWKHSVFHETPAGFAIFDLSPDGQWNRSYVNCEWKI